MHHTKYPEVDRA